MKVVKLLLALGITVFFSFERSVMGMNSKRVRREEPLSTTTNKDYFDTALDQGNYKTLFSMLDQSVVRGDCARFDWAIKTGLEKLHVPLLHWVTFHKLETRTGMMDIQELRAILYAIMVILVRTKMDEIVCFRLDNGCRNGQMAYELLRAQYYSILGSRTSLLEYTSAVDFSDLCNDVFNCFDKENADDVIVQSDLLGSPCWVYKLSRSGGVINRYYGSRICFENLSKEELLFGYEECFLDSVVKLVPLASIIDERKKAVAAFKELVEAKSSWLEFIEDSFQNFRTIAE